MAEPLSLAVNIASALAFSIQSCRYLGNFFAQISGAPTEVERHQLCFQALTATFSELRSICSDRVTANESEFPPDFRSRLEACNKDLQDMQLFVHSINNKLEGSKLIRNWARVKYAMVADQRLKKFSSRLVMYQATFTLDLIILNTKIAFQSSKQLVQLSLPTEQTLQPKPTVDNPTTAAPRPSIDLSNELPDIKYHSQIIFNSYIGTVLMYRGSLRRQKFNVGRLSTKFAFPTGTSCAFRLQLRAKCGKWQKSICVLLFLERYGFSSLSSFRCIFSHPQLLPHDAQIFRHVERGELPMVRSMFELRIASPLDTTLIGTSLLHIASAQSNVELVKFLIESGADLHASDDDGRTPLHSAMANSKNPEVCKALITKGGDLDSRDIEGKTPLHTFFNSNIGTILLDHRELIGDPDIDCYGMNMLHFAAWSNQSTVQHIAPFLKEHPCLCLVPDKEGRTIIHFASERGNVPLLNFLLEHSNAIDAMLPDGKGRSPIHYAARCRRIAAIDLLVLKGADLNAVSMEGWTVFHEAAARDNILAVEYIIKLMNDSAIPFLNMPDERGVTPLALAKKRRAINVTNYLEGRGIDWNQRQVGDTKYPVRTQHFENHTITSVVCISLVFFLGIFYVFDI